MSLLDGGELSQPGGPPVRRRLRYLQVIDLIEDLITTRGLSPGDMLPTQKELADLAGVSLITVRRALDELARIGRVTGHQGVGTFVARPRIVSEPTKSGGLLSTLAAQGERLRVETQLLELRAGKPRATVASALALGRDDLVWQIVRLRLIDAVPLVIEQALIPKRLAPDLADRRDDLRGSLYALLAAEHGLVDDHEEQYLEVRTAGARERRLLHLGPRARVVRLRGVSFTAADEPFDCFEQVYPADEFAFYISGQTSRRLFRTTDFNDWGITAPQDRP